MDISYSSKIHLISGILLELAAYTSAEDLDIPDAIEEEDDFNELALFIYSELERLDGFKPLLKLDQPEQLTLAHVS